MDDLQVEIEQQTVVLQRIVASVLAAFAVLQQSHEVVLNALLPKQILTACIRCCDDEFVQIAVRRRWFCQELVFLAIGKSGAGLQDRVQVANLLPDPLDGLAHLELDVRLERLFSRLTCIICLLAVLLQRRIIQLPDVPSDPGMGFAPVAALVH